MYKESEYLELKKELTDNIKKAIIAFANTNGGTIYIGIDDNGKVEGLRDAAKDLESLSGMIREGIKSDLTLHTKMYIQKIEGKDVIILNIEEGPNKPYYLAEKGIKTNGVFVRHGISSTPLNEEGIKLLLKQNSDSEFEKSLSNNQELTFNYMNKMFEKQKIIINKTKMQSLGLINNNGTYTNLALLLSDQCPYSIKCAIYNGNNKIEFQDRKEFPGSLFEQLDEVFKYLDMFNKVKGIIKGLYREDTKDYPDYAIRESLLNAVIHRDYNFKGSVLVHMFNNRIEIVSLGGLVSGITIKDVLKGVSEPRNHLLANIFFRLTLIESYGTGIGKILESYKNTNHKPLFDNSDNVFVVTLPNINYVEKKNEVQLEAMTKEDLIIKYIRANGKITRVIAENILELGRSRTNDLLSSLCKQSKLKKEGRGKSTIYLLK